MSESKNILDPSALLSTVPSYLPPSSKSLRSPHDALAALVHTSFSILGFRLIGISDDESSTSGFEGNVLPSEWNKSGPGSYTFRYKHDQSALEFIIKLSKLGGRTVVNAIAAESEKAASLDVSTEDFTSASFFPWAVADSGKQLVHGFISSNRVTDFTFQLRMQIIQKLVPSLRKEGYTEVDDTSTSTSTNPPSSSAPPPARPRPQNPDMPDFDEGHPYALPRGQNPFQIGRSDLDPIPGAPSFHGTFSPPPLFPGADSTGGGDGMFVGPDHPLFGPRRGGAAGIPAGGGGRGPWGGDGFLPPMGAPPGARFDPVGPGMGPFGPGRRGPGGGFGPTPPRRNLGDPDNDEFMPPGAGDMYM